MGVLITIFGLIIAAMVFADIKYDLDENMLERSYDNYITVGGALCLSFIGLVIYCIGEYIWGIM
tara:strand:+ start:195 stop:386 length:192 start_codon:yes stop_codon:yes gene_type:complete